MKRIICTVLAIAFILLTALSVSAVDFGCTVNPVAKAVYLKNLDTGAVVYQKEAEQQMYPASTTKIMTYVIVADNIADFDNTMVTVDESVLNGLDPESTVMGLAGHIGESFSIRDLLYGMMLPSGNDAALVLADYVGKGIENFVQMMNAKAAELGCTGTHFVNPHGLYDSNHFTTAKDLAAISEYAMKCQSFMDITNTVEYKPSGFEYSFKNTNYMLYSEAESGNYYYQYTKGIKTGYTDEAGKCLVTSAEKDGFTYLCVELGTAYSYSEDINYAMLDAKSLYEWAFNDLGKQTVYGPSDIVKSIPVKYVSGDKELAAVPEKEVVALLPNNYDKNLVAVDIKCPDTVESPVHKGDVLGTVSVRYDDMDLGTTNVIASEDIERNQIKYFFAKTAEFIKTHVIVIIIGVVLIILLIILILALRARHKRAARARAREQARRRFRD